MSYLHGILVLSCCSRDGGMEGCWLFWEQSVGAPLQTPLPTTFPWLKRENRESSWPESCIASSGSTKHQSWEPTENITLEGPNWYSWCHSAPHGGEAHGSNKWVWFSRNPRYIKHIVWPPKDPHLDNQGKQGGGVESMQKMRISYTKVFKEFVRWVSGNLLDTSILYTPKKCLYPCLLFFFYATQREHVA